MFALLIKIHVPSAYVIVRQTSDIAEYFALGLLLLGLATWLAAQVVKAVDAAAPIAVALVLLLASAALGAASEERTGDVIAGISFLLVYVYLGAIAFSARRRPPVARILEPRIEGELEPTTGIDESPIRREVTERVETDIGDLPVIFEAASRQELIPHAAQTMARLADRVPCVPRLLYGRRSDQQEGALHRARSALITQLTVLSADQFLLIEVAVRGRSWRGLPPLRWRRADLKTSVIVRCEHSGSECVIGADLAGTSESKGDGIHIVVEPTTKAEGRRLEIAVVVRVGLNPQGGPTDTTVGIPGTPIKQTGSWATADHQNSLNGGTHVWECAPMDPRNTLD